MLTGEWGCGKTYLLNKQLKDELKKTHVLLRISLFGISSIEEVKAEVKQRWLYAFAENLNCDNKTAENVNKVSGVAKQIACGFTGVLPEKLGAIANGILSLNVLDFVKIDAMMRDKKVVLIFDDLERANVSTNDLLGCINDYCENQGILTIIVANEQKICTDDGDKIKYEEIKEKIIQRTVHHTPDYMSIVNSIIQDMEFRSETYKALLNKHEMEIGAIFSGTTIEGKTLDNLVEERTNEMYRTNNKKENERIQKLLRLRPHNIRSLKCALQDFYRIFDLLEKYEIPEKHKWLFSYIAYVFSYRAGIVVENKRYGTLFSDNDISLLYPGFYNEKNITRGIKDWIHNGEWNCDKIKDELNYVKKRDEATKPEEKVKTSRIFDLEENDIYVGFPILLEKAYQGNLELDDYVNLLCNSSLARAYGIHIPDVDWKRVQKGVCDKIDSLLKSHIEQSHYCVVIGDESRKDFLDEEWETYEIIKTFRNEEKQIYENNKNLFMSLMRVNPLEAFVQTRNKRFEFFDVEMAEVTLGAFEHITNAERNDFVSYFKNIWGSNIGISDDCREKSQEGMRRLRTGLERFLGRCNKEALTITAFHTKRFISVITDLVCEKE